jgi:hypothetical protein
VRFGDLAKLLEDEGRARPTVLVTTCEELERPGVNERVAGAGLRLVKLPGPVPGALRRECRSRGTPFVEMSGLSLQQSPYLEPDEPVPLLGDLSRQLGALLGGTGRTASRWSTRTGTAPGGSLRSTARGWRPASSLPGSARATGSAGCCGTGPTTSRSSWGQHGAVRDDRDVSGADPMLAELAFSLGSY